jgi:spore coat polysaccharide biosynthesis predicted glycosyltransferase SpsG
MRYVLRADASQSIGSGHVMRSSAIAEELISRGEEVIFVGEFSDVPWLAVRINGLGFSQILPSPVSFISDPKTDVLILDSYLVPASDEFIQRRKWKAVVSIVDKLSPPYISDLMIHPSLSVDWISFTNTKVLAGPQYIPFRKSIKKDRHFVPESGVFDILIIGGGTDSFNFVGAMCGALRNIQGNFRAYFFTSDIALAQLDSRFTAVPIGSDLDAHAATAELVFTTASTTSLEFIAREIAVGIGCSIDNQEEYYETLSSTGVASPIGRFIEGSWKINQSRIAKLVDSREVRETLRRNCAGLIDLEGAGRIVNEILKL